MTTQWMALRYEDGERLDDVRSAIRWRIDDAHTVQAYYCHGDGWEGSIWLIEDRHWQGIAQCEPGHYEVEEWFDFHMRGHIYVIMYPRKQMFVGPQEASFVVEELTGLDLRTRKDCLSMFERDSPFRHFAEDAPAAYEHRLGREEGDYLVWDDIVSQLPVCDVCGARVDDYIPVDAWSLNWRLVRDSMPGIASQTQTTIWNRFEREMSRTDVYVCDDACKEMYQFMRMKEIEQWLERVANELRTEKQVAAAQKLLRRTRSALRTNNLEACKSLRMEFGQLQTLRL